MRRWHLLVGVCVVIVMGVGLFPLFVQQMPGRFRYYLPEEWVAAVVTPLPLALPTAKRPFLPPPTPFSTPTSTATNSPPRKTAVSTPPATTEPTATPLPATPTSTPIPYPPHVQLDEVAIVPQKFNNCGPTNLAISLQYFGLDIDQHQIAAHVRPHYEDRNVSPEELVVYVETETPLQARAYSGGTRQMLQQLLALGLPLIVEKGLIDDESWLGHYLTLTGYDDQAAHFFTLDTLLGPWDGTTGTLSYDELAIYWQQFNYTFLVIYPADMETAVSHILPTTQSEAMWQNAAQLATAETVSIPDNPYPWFNLGTSLAQLGHQNSDAALWEAAAAAFDQARARGLPPRMLWYQFQPYEVYLKIGRYDDVLALAEATALSQGGRSVEETHYYQGMALAARHEYDPARLAFKRALALRPTYPEAKQALETLP